MSQLGDTRPQCPFILASASPRRAALLREYDYEFDIVVAPLKEPERLADATTPAELAEALSYFKARAVADGFQRGVVLGADTVAALGGTIFGKPTGVEDARRILQSLSGTRHEVITGVTLLDAATGKREIRHTRTGVVMKSLSEKELSDYLATGAWQGKAGAYGIQDYGDAFVERIEGSFTNVVGLPMELVTSMLDQWGIKPRMSEEDHDSHGDT
ncbi:MAG: septum formation protein Maf [Planctomycetes bacterium]|nr:septum formation protein Maf [Planctomycetota bacterium]